MIFYRFYLYWDCKRVNLNNYTLEKQNKYAKNIEIILIRNKIMGQKCCRPAIRQNPKHTELLNLIYTETPQNIKKIDHEGITEYLNKKGYVKTLSDYLSSHLYLINSSFLYCKSKLVSNRTKKPFTQLYFSFLTSEVALKIALMCRQVKLIYYNKNNPNKKQLIQQGQKSGKVGQGKLEDIQLNLMSNNKQFNDLRQGTKRKLKRKNMKSQIFQRQFLQQDINLIVLDICNEMLKQSINTKYFFHFQVKPQQTLAEEAAIHKTLVNVEKILSNVLSDRQGSFIKIDYSVIKQLLDNQIILLVMANSKSKQHNTYSLSVLNLGRQSSRKTLEGQSQSENNLLSSINKLPNLNFELDQAFNFRSLCLQNYSRLLYKAKINQADINLSKDIVKIHLPILLEMLANLMIEKSYSNIRIMESQIKGEIMLEKNADLKISKSTAKQMKEETQRNQEYKKRNISHMQLIIQSIIFELFNSYFSLKESEYIYKELILIFDKLCFQQSQILSIQRLVFIALKKHELKDFVMSKWFDYLLDYLAIVTTFTSPPQMSQNTFTPEFLNSNQLYVETSENYLGRINVIANPQIQRSQYTNWRKQQNITGCLRTIIRWIAQDQVDIESIINFKHNKIIFAVLANLAWGSPKINKKIYELMGLLIESNIRCFQYLVNGCMAIINRLRIGYIVDVQHDWGYFITKWEQDKIRIKKGHQFDEKSKVQKKNTLKLRVKRKSIAAEQDAQIQLISIEKYLDELIQLTCYPFLFKIKQEINDNILQVVDSEEIKKSHKRYSSLGEPFLKMSQTEEKEDEKPNRNTRESTFDQIQKNTPNNYTFLLYHLKSTMQIPEIGTKKQKKNVDPSLFFIVFSETLQQLFKNVKFHHHRHDKNCRALNLKNRLGCIKRQPNYWQVKLTSLILSSNLITMVKLIDESSDRKNRQTDFNHILQLTGILNKFFAKLCREIKHHHSHISQRKQQLNQIRKNSISMNSMNGSFDFQRQSSIDNKQINILNQYQTTNNLSKESIEQDFHKSFQKQRKLIDKNINMISNLFDIIHIWVYPALTYLLEYSSLLTNYSKDRSQGYQTDNLNIKHTKLTINIITKLYYQNLLRIAIEILTKEIHLNRNSKIVQNEQKQNDSQYSQSDISILEIKSPNIWRNQNIEQIEGGYENEIFLQLRQKFLTTFLSVLQLYSLFFLFYNLYEKKGGSTDNILYSNKSSTPTRSQQKRNGQQRQFLNKIKANEQNLKNYLQNINKEINNKVKNRIILSTSLWQETILQTESVLNEKKLSEMMIQFVDEITYLQNNEIQKQIEKQEKKAQQFQSQKRKILKSINKHIFIESDYKEMNSSMKATELQQSYVQPTQMQERNQCFSFQKTKKKILKAFNRVSTVQPQSTLRDPNIMESKMNKMNLIESESKLTTKPTQIELLGVSLQNAQANLPKIIDYFSQSYMSNQINKIGPKSNYQFNFNLNLERGEDSVVNSSVLNEETLQGSFAEVLTEIKKS